MNIEIFEYESTTIQNTDIHDISFLNNFHSKHVKIKKISSSAIELKAKSFIGKICLPSGTSIIIKPKVKISNLLYLISYTHNLVKFDNYEKKSVADNKSIMDIYIIVFLQWLDKLFLKGLYKNYETSEEELSTIKGKIIIKSDIYSKNKITCAYDEITFSTIENKVIKATLYHVICSKELDIEIRQKSLILYRLLKEIPLIKLSKNTFSNISIHKLNSHYNPIIELCKLIFNNLRLNDKNGEIIFSSYLFDINIIYEKFLLKILQEKLPHEVVKPSLKSDWAESINNNKLPQIKPDILIENKAIIDAKYYKTPFSNNGKYMSSHIYQIIVYLQAYKIKNGYLVYPQMEDGEIVKSSYSFNDLTFTLMTIPLNRNIEDIENAIMDIVNEISTIPPPSV